MKKALSLLLLLFVTSLLTAQGYQINDVTYNITGCGARIFSQTQDYVLAREVPVDKKTVFEDTMQLSAYLEDYNKKLKNLRAFDTIDVSWEVISQNKEDTAVEAQENEPEEVSSVTEPCKIRLIVTVKDSFHLFAIPGPKYDSNTGLIFKLKIKDSNFLGSLDTLSSDIYFLIPTSESDAVHPEIGVNANFDYPFMLFGYDATWLNDFGISYTFDDDLPEWNLSTGLRLEIPVSQHSLVFETKQKFINDFTYEEFDDSIYFVNVFSVSMPIKLKEMKYFGPLLYTPYTSATINWDDDGISKMNSSLSSPIATFGHKLTFGRTDWDQNLRTGFKLSIDNYYTYNFQRERFYPIIELHTTAFKKFDLFEDFFMLRNIGFAADFRAFTYFTNPKNNRYIFNDGKSIGGYLRGIRDNQNYEGTEYSSLHPTSALILNFDIPIHILRTNFKRSFLKYCNFDLQLSPFFDMALCYNKITKTYCSFEDGFYGAGLEVIVYPLKWTGITIRGSVGIDVGRKFFHDSINTEWRDSVSRKEFSLGFGLHY